MPETRNKPTRRGLVRWTIAAAMTIELVLIIMQAGRGTTSHFNITSALNAAIFAVMGITITISTMAMMLFIWILRRDTPPRRAGYLWGVRLGVSMFVIACWLGFVIVANNGHSVPAPDGGPGLPFVNWSTIGGDLRIVHFFGMHAMQALPISRLPARPRRRPLGAKRRDGHEHPMACRDERPADDGVARASAAGAIVGCALFRQASPSRPGAVALPTEHLSSPETFQSLPDGAFDMNYYGAREMAESWRTVRKNTIQVAEDIPEDKYSFRAAPDTMSVGEILAHLAVTPHWAQQCHFVDKKSTVIAMEDFGRWMGDNRHQRRKTLTSKAAIVDALKKNGEQFAGQHRRHDRRAARREGHAAERRRRRASRCCSA